MILSIFALPLKSFMQNSEGNNIIRVTDSKYLDDIVALHINAFPRVLSGQTGKLFLRSFYQRLFKNGFVLAKITDGRLSGFIAGIADDDMLYSTGSRVYDKFGFEFVRDVNLYGLPLRLYVKNLNH